MNMRFSTFLFPILLAFISCASDSTSKDNTSSIAEEDSTIHEDIAEDIEEELIEEEEKKPEIPVQVCAELIAKYASFSDYAFNDKIDSYKDSIEAIKNTESFYYCRDREEFKKSMDSIDNLYIVEEIDLNNVF